MEFMSCIMGSESEECAPDGLKSKFERIYHILKTEVKNFAPKWIAFIWIGAWATGYRSSNIFKRNSDVDHGKS